MSLESIRCVSSSQAHSSLLANLLDILPRIIKESTFFSPLLCLKDKKNFFHLEPLEANQSKKYKLLQREI